MELYALSLFAKCTDFQSLFHFQVADLNLQLLDLIHTDTGVPLFIIRLFHNKFIIIILDIYTSITHYFDPLFITSFLSFFGMIFFVFGCWTFFTKRNRFSLLLIPLFISILLEMLIHPKSMFPERFGLLAFLFLLISLYGNWAYFDRFHSKMALVIWASIFLIGGLWILFLPSDLYRFCIQR